MIFDRSLVMDQTGQRQATTIITGQDSRQQLIELYFETAAEGIVLTDSDGIIVAVNDTFGRLTGCTAKDLVGISAEEAARAHLPDAYAEALILAVESVLDGMATKPVEMQIRTFTVVVRPFTNDGTTCGALCIIKPNEDDAKNVKVLEQFETPGRSLVEIISDIIYRLDNSGVISYISPAVTRYGYTPEMLVGRNIIDFVHPDDREQAAYKLNDRRTGNRSTTLFEVRFLGGEDAISKPETDAASVNGNWPVFLVSASGLYEATPTATTGFLGTIGIARDITRRKHDEQEMLRTSSMLHNILHSSSRFAIIATDCAYRIMHLNQAAEQLFAIDQGAGVGRYATELLERMGIESGRLNDAFAAALSYGTYQFTVVPEQKAQHLMLTIMPLRDTDARHNGYVIYSYDITDRKRAEEALLHYQRAVEGSSSLIAAVNREGAYVFANQAFCTYHGLVRERVLGRSAPEVFGSERFLAEIEPYLTACFNGEEVHIELPCQCPRLGERYLSVTYYPLKGSNGEIKGVVSVAEDITTRREAQKRIQDTLAEKEKLIVELKAALDEVKTLRGFIPICAHCKKIRDDEGYWEQVEDYIQAHSEAEFSHSICPDCMDKYFPDIKPGKSTEKTD